MTIDAREELAFQRRRLLLALVLLLALCLPAIAQSNDSSEDEAGGDSATVEQEAEDEAEMMDDEAMDEEAEAMDADMPAIDLESIIPLEMRTYEAGWVRFVNLVEYGAPLLPDDEEMVKFPFRAVSLTRMLNADDVTDLEILAEIVDETDLAYDETLVTGVCDTARMQRYNSGDILCVPGTSAMPAGFAMTILYHPETYEVVALTTTIDNIGGVASRAVAAPAQAPAAPADTAAPAGDGAGCGPYASGQWIKAADYQASGLNLPVNTSNALGAITDYECVVPASGQPFLNAWTVAAGASSRRGNMGDSDGDDDGGSCADDWANWLYANFYHNDTPVYRGPDGTCRVGGSCGTPVPCQ